MTLSIKNGGYAFLITLDLMFSFNLSIKYLIKLILCENYVKTLKI